MLHTASLFSLVLLGSNRSPPNSWDEICPRQASDWVEILVGKDISFISSVNLADKVIFNRKQVFPAKFHLLKPLLHVATFCTACLAMALKKNSHERLHDVTLLPVPQIITRQVA